MDKGKYYGYIVKGDLRGAINYVKQFPEQTDLYNRFMAVFDREQYISYEVNDVLNDILTAYQQYYRDVFYLCTDKEQSEAGLRDRLTGIIGITDNSVAETNVELCDLEQHQLAELFQQQGFHFLGGRTSGYYGPYIWRTTEIVSYDVELPEGIQTFPVKFLDGFIARSWTDYLSFGEVGSGGWVDSEGYINCVKSAWDFDSESFRISLLKHEAQHARDLQTDKEMSSEDLEYRAKLVELIYSDERNLLPAFAQEADSADKRNGHAMAAYRIIKGFSDALGVDRIDPAAIPVKKIQAVARRLFTCFLERQKSTEIQRGYQKMTNERVYQMDFNKVYQLLVSKAVKKGRTKEEVDQVTGWLTGYSREELEGMAEKKISYGDFFRNAPQLNENRRLIKGVVCGVRVEDIEEPLMQEIRYLDKLVDELAKGKPMDKILRK